MGLVTQVFDERRLAPLDGHLAIGHVRYSTTGSSTWRNAQPVYRSVADAGFSLGHNGNLTNTEALAERARHAARRAHLRQRADRRAARARVRPTTLRSDGRDLEHALEKVLPRLAGAFSLVLMDEAHLFGVRDRARLPPARARPHRRRLGARERDRRARHRRRALRPRRRAGRAGRDRRDRRALDPLRGADPEALPVRVRLHRASRHAALRPERARGPPAHGRGARAPGAVRRRRHGDAGPRVGCAGRAGLRARVAASPTATAS